MQKVSSGHYPRRNPESQSKLEKRILLYLPQSAGAYRIGIDYEKKTISATKAIMPSGDINKDMREIKLYYKDFKGKHPENFALGEI